MGAPLNLKIWIDRMRVIRQVAGPRVEGETQYEETVSPWVPCRMPPREASEQPEADKDTIVDTYQVTARLTALDGSRQIVSESDRIEIETGPTTFVPQGVFEVLQAFVPRDGVGGEKLQVISVSRLVEH